MTEKYKLVNLDCAECARKIEDGLKRFPGVRSVSVDFATLSMHIDAADIEGALGRVTDIEPDVRIERGGGAGGTEAGAAEGSAPAFAVRRELLILGAGAVLFILGLIFSRRFHQEGRHWLEYAVFGSAYLLAGWNVLASAARGLLKGRLFNEHFLMTVATGGALAIHATSEAAAVMIFYKIGEILENLAVDRNRRSIRKLLSLRPDSARLIRHGKCLEVRPEEVCVGDEVSVRPGERVPLDGVVVTGTGFMDTSAMTGESVPRHVGPGKAVLAGYISSDSSLVVRVTRLAGESGAARIVRLVEEATHAKAKTERFITRFARIYTPMVVGAAAIVAFLPPLLGAGELHGWVYRALTMLVISCPCAFVVSIPLTYFGGIGGASRHGILVKGARHLDALAAVKTVVFDKTGTLTRGVFRVTAAEPSNGTTAADLLKYAAMAEAHSNHPIAASIREAYGRPLDQVPGEACGEIGGHGVWARADGARVIAGNDRLMHRENISHDTCHVAGTAVHVAVGGSYAGYLVIGDELKSDAVATIEELHAMGISRTVLLTGDSNDVARTTAGALGIREYHGQLLPEDKVAHLERILQGQKGRARTAFVGDGINDAPVLARSDVGIAMGESGSDAAVETADVVLMSDSPGRVAEAIRRARRTRGIVIQNIVFALGVKAIFLALGASGVATMWEAVIADMGVTLVAVLNAARAMR